MNNGLLYLGSFLALLLAVLFGGPYFVDWNGYRGVFEEEATKVLGRDVRVGGGVSVRLLPTPYVRFEKVRLADTTGQTGEPFIRVESFTMRLAVSPLLRGAFEATDIELYRPVLSLVPNDEGGGNWSSLQLRPAELPFIPENVTLHAVRIVDGAIAVHRAGAGTSRVELINGELSAETLQGPYKFKGSGFVGSAERDIKFSTFAPDDKGAVRIKAALHGKEGENSYLFDGQIENFATKPLVSGEVTGKLVLAAPRRADGTASAEPPPRFDLKSTVKADARGAQFDAVELNLEGSGEPQLITGKASAAWVSQPRIDAALTANWLDLDAIGAAKDEQTTVTGLKSMFVALMDGLAGGSDATTATGVRLDIAQVKFGGERAGSLQLDAERTNEGIKLRRLNSGLPGGARFELSGHMTTAASADGASFSGDVLLRGVNFERLKTFAQRSGIDLDLKSQGPFWLAGRVDVSGARVLVSDAKAEVSGQSVSGTVDIAQGERKRVAVRLEGARIDTAIFFPQMAEHLGDELVRAFGTVEKPEAAKPAQARVETSLSIATGELLHGGQSYKDVQATLVADGQTLQLSNVQFALPEGAQFKGAGRVERADHAKGTLSYEFEARGQNALREAATFVGLTSLIGENGLEPLNDMKLAGFVRLGAGGPAGAEVTFDGLADEARIAGSAGFEGGFKAWATAPVRLALRARANAVAEVLKLLGVDAETRKGVAARAGEATIALSGPLSSGAKTYADITAQGLTADLTGTLTLRDGAFAHAATGSVKAASAREALALAGLATPGALANAPLEGTVAVAGSKERLTLSSTAMKAGGTQFKGSVDIARAAADKGGPHVTGKIDADRITVPGLLALVTEASSASGQPMDDAPQASWPDGAFKLEPLTQRPGSIDVTFKDLEVADGISAHDGRARIEFAPGSVKVASLTAKAAGGDLIGEVMLDKGAAGVSVSTALKLNGELSSFSPRAAGRLQIDLTAQGRGGHPAAAIAAMSGKGSARLEDVRHPAPSAAFVSDVSDAALAGKADMTPALMTDSLAGKLGQSIATTGSRTIGLTIAGGDVKVEPYALESPRGNVRVATVVSLAKLWVDSTWQVQAVATPPPPPEPGFEWKPAPKGPLPAVDFVYTGRLARLAALQVDISADALARELVVRAMERKVEELEFLRRRDEERRKQDLERRRALELEREQAAAAAAAAKAAAQAQARQGQPAGAVAPSPPDAMPPVVPEANPVTPPQDGLPGEAAEVGAPAKDPDVKEPEAKDAPALAQPRTVPRPQPATRPQRSSRTSTSEEVNKAFGGWP